MTTKAHPSRKLRIAVVSDAIYPYHRGGKETRIFELTRRLAARGHDVHVYTMKWWEGEPSRVEHGVHLHAISRHYPLYAGPRRSILQGVMFGLACLRLWRERFDVLEVDHMPYFPLFACKLVSLVRRRPMSATWHEVWGAAYWRQYLGRLGLLAAALERLTVLMPDQITAVSPATATALRDRLGYRGPLHVVDNGIDLETIERVAPAGRSSDVVFAGRLIEHKHVDILVRAITQIVRRQPNIRCAIIGDGPELKNLKALARTLNVAQNIEFVGYVPQLDDVYAYMKASRVFVLPSTREGFGIVALEAMACGLPVVTVDHPDNAARHLIDSSNGLVTALDPAEVAQAITRLLQHPPANPAAEASDYDWNNLAPRWEKVWQS